MDRIELGVSLVELDHEQRGGVAGTGKRNRTNRNRCHAGRARSDVVHAASGIIAFPELRVSKRDK